MNKLEIINSEIESVNACIDAYDRNLFLIEIGRSGGMDKEQVLKWKLEEETQKARLEKIRDDIMVDIDKEQSKVKAGNVNSVAESLMKPTDYPTRFGVIELKEDTDLEKEMNNLIDISGRNVQDVMREQGINKFSVEIKLPFVFDKNKSFQENMKDNGALFAKLREVDEKFQPARDLKELGK
jgi:hypothetical protein